MRRLIEVYRSLNIWIRVIFSLLILLLFISALLLIGYSVNSLVLGNASFKVAGQEKDWILFYGSLSSATITSLFAIAAVTLSYSFSKLDEENKIKRKLQKILGKRKNVYYSLLDIFYATDLDEIIMIDDFKLLNKKLGNNIKLLYKKINRIYEHFQYQDIFVDNKLINTAQIYTYLIYELSKKEVIIEQDYDAFNVMISSEFNAKEGLIKLFLNNQKTLSVANNRILLNKFKSKYKHLNTKRITHITVSKRFKKEQDKFIEFTKLFKNDIVEYNDLYIRIVSDLSS